MRNGKAGDFLYGVIIFLGVRIFLIIFFCVNGSCMCGAMYRMDNTVLQQENFELNFEGGSVAACSVLKIFFFGQSVWQLFCRFRVLLKN